MECELCRSAARMYCESDQASLCWNCDAKVHGANFLVARHSRRLLCHACQSQTPWKASGPKLGRTVSFCDRCVLDGCGSRTVNRTAEEGSTISGSNDLEDEHDDDDDEEEEDLDAEDAEEDEDEDDDDVDVEDEADNQVVPWSSTTPPPSASSSSSEDSSSKLSNGYTDDSEEQKRVCVKRPHRTASNLAFQESSADGEATSCVDSLRRPLKYRRTADVDRAVEVQAGSRSVEIFVSLDRVHDQSLSAVDQASKAVD